MRAPLVAPGVLHNETVFVVAHDGERVAVRGFRQLWIGNGPYTAGRRLRAALARVTIVPAGGCERAREQHARLIQRDLHVDHGAGINPVVSAHWATNTIVPPIQLVGW